MFNSQEQTITPCRYPHCFHSQLDVIKVHYFIINSKLPSQDFLHLRLKEMKSYFEEINLLNIKSRLSIFFCLVFYRYLPIIIGPSHHSNS